MNTDTNRCDIIVSQHVITAQVSGQDILFKTKGNDWTVSADADLGDIILAACTLLDFEREKTS